jgi:WD40 repeat protein
MRKLVCFACSAIIWTVFGVLYTNAAEVPTIVVSNGLEVTYAEFSPDGSKILTMGGSLRVWQASDGAMLSEVAEASGFFDSVFGPGGREVLILNWNTDQFELRSATSGALVLTLPGHQRGFGGSLGRFSPSEDMIATLDRNTVRIWEYPSGRLKHQISNGEVVSDIVFSPEGQFIYTSQYEIVTPWSTDTGQPWRGSKFPNMNARILAISGKGNFVATTAGLADRLVALIDFSSGREVIDIFRDTSTVTDVMLI